MINVELNKHIPFIVVRNVKRKDSCANIKRFVFGYTRKSLVRQSSQIISAIFLSSIVCSCCGRGSSSHNELDSVQVPAPAITYNFYIENSGSMKGYFSSVNNNLITIIAEYNDRIDEKKGGDDTITLNYINTRIQRVNLPIKGYLNSAKSNCTAQFTKLDDILAMAMDSLSDNHVNIVISDYCFTSNNSSLATAKSGITNLFATRLRNNRDLSIAIVKYDCDFNGTYYPGGIPCNHSLPIYVWAFGPSNQIKRITQLDVKEPHNIMVLQPWQELQPVYKVKDKRMLEKDGNSVIVKNWKKDHHDGLYRITFDVDMSSVALDKKYILDINNYNISGDYIIDSIQKGTIQESGQDMYTYTISTTHPSPSTISINLINAIPEWVEDSNFDGNGVPVKGKTFGIQPLIEGVYDAYHNMKDCYATINVILK